MNATTIVLVTLLVVVVALFLLLTLTLCGRVVRLRRDRQREAIRAEIRPAVVAVLASPDAPPPLALPAHRPAEALFEILAFDFLAKVRGESRRALVDVLVDRGTVAAAEQRAGRPGSVGRLAAIELLGRCGLARSRRAVEPNLRHRSPDVRAAAVRALGRLGTTEVVPALLDSLQGKRCVSAALVAQALVRVGPASAAPLAEALDDRRDAVRSVAATVLGLLQAVSAVPDLLRVLVGDASDVVRAHAARALGRIGDPRATMSLVEVSASPALTEVAAGALGELGDHRAVARLVELVGAPAHDTATVSAVALGRCGPAGRAALHTLRDGDDTGRARYALDALARAVVAAGDDPATSSELVAVGLGAATAPEGRSSSSPDGTAEHGP